MSGDAREPEYVVLVDEHNNEIGQALKSEVHTDATPLHRAFSIFLFNQNGELLLQQRNLEKKTWPGIWSNSCCGHLSPGESAEEAVRRRVPHELGITLAEVWNVLPDYRYRVELDGVVENEICPVFIGFIEETPEPNPEEIADTRWVSWSSFLAEVKKPHPPYSAWSIEEAQLLEKSSLFQQLFADHTG